MVHDMWLHLAPGAMESEGAPLTLDLAPLAPVTNCLLICSLCLFHGASLALDLGPQLAPGTP